MKLELEFGVYYCYTPTFIINDIEADRGDFGEAHDISPIAGDYVGCGNMQFTRIPASKEVLDRYGISQSEYSLIAGQLEVGLSFGPCGWCE